MQKKQYHKSRRRAILCLDIQYPRLEVHSTYPTNEVSNAMQKRKWNKNARTLQVTIFFPYRKNSRDYSQSFVLKEINELSPDYDLEKWRSKCIFRALGWNNLHQKNCHFFPLTLLQHIKTTKMYKRWHPKSPIVLQNRSPPLKYWNIYCHLQNLHSVQICPKFSIHQAWLQKDLFLL